MIGIELSFAYFLAVCVITAGCLGLSITIAMPQRPRLGGICIAGVALGYLAVSFCLASLWGDLMNDWYGQWPSFTLGVIVGVPALVVTAGAELGMLVMALVAVVSGRTPAWIVRSREKPVWSRLGIALIIVSVLCVVGGIVLKLILR